MLRPWQLERCEPQHSRWLGGFMIHLFVASLRDAGGWVASRSQDCAPSGLGLGYCRCVPTGRRGWVASRSQDCAPSGLGLGYCRRVPTGRRGWVASRSQDCAPSGLAWAIGVASLRDARGVGGIGSQDCAPSGLGLGYCRCVPTGRRGFPGLRVETLRLRTRAGAGAARFVVGRVDS